MPNGTPCWVQALFDLNAPLADADLAQAILAQFTVVHEGRLELPRDLAVARLARFLQERRLRMRLVAIVPTERDIWQGQPVRVLEIGGSGVPGDGLIVWAGNLQNGRGHFMAAQRLRLTDQPLPPRYCTPNFPQGLATQERLASLEGLARRHAEEDSYIIQDEAAPLCGVCQLGAPEEARCPECGFVYHQACQDAVTWCVNVRDDTGVPVHNHRLDHGCMECLRRQRSHRPPVLAPAVHEPVSGRRLSATPSELPGRQAPPAGMVQPHVSDSAVDSADAHHPVQPAEPELSVPEGPEARPVAEGPAAEPVSEPSLPPPEDLPGVQLHDLPEPRRTTLAPVRTLLHGLHRLFGGPPQLPAFEWRDVVVITSEYLPELSQAHQCLAGRGRASRRAHQGSNDRWGPFCTCNMGATWVQTLCPHALRRLVGGGLLLIYDWQLAWARKYLVYANAYMYSRNDRRVRGRVVEGTAHQVWYVDRPDAPGDEAPPVMPCPRVAAYRQGAQDWPCLEPTALRAGGAFTLHRPLVPWHEQLSGLIQEANTLAGCWDFIRGFGGGTLILVVDLIWEHLGPYATYLVNGAANALGGPGWLGHICGHLGLAGALIKLLAAVTACLGAGHFIVGGGAVLIVWLLKMGLFLFTMRFLPTSRLAAMGFASTGPLQAALVLFFHNRFMSPMDPVVPRPDFDQVVATGSAAVDAAFVRRAMARQVGGSDLLAPLLVSVSAAANWPALHRHGVERATARYENSLPGVCVGSAPRVRQKRGCKACGAPLHRRRRNMGLCRQCFLALPDARGEPDPDARREALIGEALPVNEPTGLVALYSEPFEPVIVEQRREVEDYHSTFMRDKEQKVRHHRHQNRRKRAVLVGVGHPTHMPGVFQRGPESLHHGMMSRTYRAVGQRHPATYGTLAAVLDHCLPTLGSDLIDAMELEEWFQGQERELDMRMAWRDYQLNGLPDAAQLVCKPFIKSEFHYAMQANGQWFTKLRAAKQRPIYTLPDITQVFVGPYTKPLMHYFKNALGGESSVHYCGCNTPEDNQRVLDILVAHVGQGDPVWLNDFSCYETTQGPHTFRLLRGLYRRLWRSHDDLREWAMDLWERMPFKAQSGGEKFWGMLPAMMLSGRPDTAITNSVLNAIVSVAAHAAARFNMPLHQVDQLTEAQWQAMHSDYHFFFVGDDSVVTGPGGGLGYEARLEAAYASAGFMSKIEKVTALRDVVFLGHRPYLLEDQGGRMVWRWGPTLGRRLYKHHWALDLVGDPMDWLTTVVDMEVRCYGPLPVIGTMARRLQGLLGAPKPLNKTMRRRMASREQYTMHVAPMQGDHVCWATFVELGEVYGLSASDVADLDYACSQIPTVPYWFSHPALDAMMRKDN